MENSWAFMLENYGNYDNFFQKNTENFFQIYRDTLQSDLYY